MLVRVEELVLGDPGVPPAGETFLEVFPR